VARRSWLENLNPARWLERIVDAITPSPAPRRRTPPPSPDRPTPPRGPTGGGGGLPYDDEENDSDFRDSWADMGGVGSYTANKEIFDSLPGMYGEDHETRLELWDTYITYMNGQTGYLAKDPNNPFWGAVGVTPDRFDWQAWRATKGDTP
jgi:hypothetical protein